MPLGAHLALLLVQLSFATGAVEGKLAMAPLADGGGGVSPLALAMTRMLAAALVFQAAGRALGLVRAISRRDHVAVLGLALLGVVVNQILFLVGLRLTSAVSAALLCATIPVFTAVIAVAARREQGSPRLVAGLVVAVLGVLWLTGVRSVDRGSLLVAANCLAYSAYVVFARDVIVRMGAATFITWVFTWGAIVLAPVGLPAVVRDVPAWGARAYVLVAVVVLVPTIVAYAVNAWALGRAEATLVAIYVCLQPVLAAVLARVQLGHALHARMGGSAALIFAGVFLVATRRRARQGP
jgi:drug/metabolite transporter (DMT)-like permease